MSNILRHRELTINEQMLLDALNEQMKTIDMEFFADPHVIGEGFKKAQRIVIKHNVEADEEDNSSIHHVSVI